MTPPEIAEEALNFALSFFSALALLLGDHSFTFHADNGTADDEERARPRPLLAVPARVAKAALHSRRAADPYWSMNFLRERFKNGSLGPSNFISFPFQMIFVSRVGAICALIGQLATCSPVSTSLCLTLVSN